MSKNFILYFCETLFKFPQLYFKLIGLIKRQKLCVNAKSKVRLHYFFAVIRRFELKFQYDGRQFTGQQLSRQI